MAKNNRYKKAKVVTFSENYVVGTEKSKKTLHKKGDSIMCHENIVESLKKNGAKFTTKDFDYEAHTEKAAIKLAKMKAKKEA